MKTYLSTVNFVTQFIDWHLGRCDSSRRDEAEVLFYKWAFWMLTLWLAWPLFAAMMITCARTIWQPAFWLLLVVACLTRRRH